jgi:hypothetical protein
VSRPEKELTVQITDVDCVQVNYLDVAKSRESEVFEEFTSYATGATEEYARG